MKHTLSDAVTHIAQQWHKERPDIDTYAMEIIGRLKRCSAHIQRQLEQTFSQFGLSSGEFDALATLRRSGEPYCLAPTTLFCALMITSGTMTHRLQRLEAQGWIERIANPDDARSSLVKLTEKGFHLIDQVIGIHAENEKQILSSLTSEELEQLNMGLHRLLCQLEKHPNNT